MIGWWNFMLGRITPKFAAVQQQHYMSMEKRQQGKTWSRKLIRQLWDIAWTMWEHRNFITHHTLTTRKEALLAQIFDETFLWVCGPAKSLHCH